MYTIPKGNVNRLQVWYSGIIQNHPQTAIYKELEYESLKYFDYRLSTVHVKKKNQNLDFNEHLNNRNRFEY